MDHALPWLFSGLSTENDASRLLVPRACVAVVVSVGEYDELHRHMKPINDSLESREATQTQTKHSPASLARFDRRLCVCPDEH